MDVPSNGDCFVPALFLFTVAPGGESARKEFPRVRSRNGTQSWGCRQRAVISQIPRAGLHSLLPMTMGASCRILPEAPQSASGAKLPAEIAAGVPSEDA